MPKGSAKFGGKSGVLPEVRQIFKKPTSPIVRPVNPNVGYAEGVQHPKNITRDQPLPEIKTVGDLIQDTVKEPRSIPDLHALNDVQKEKVSKAALRRQYYVDSLKHEEKRLDAAEKRNTAREEQEAKAKAETVYEESESTRLTLPTISKLLDGPLMRPRTEEETQILQAKRTANRLQKELTGQSNRATDLLSLYYSAENFITTEDALKTKIEDAFNSNKTATMPTRLEAGRSSDSALLDALFGNINSKPGLVEIEEQITGERQEFKKAVTDAVDRDHTAQLNETFNKPL